jgi:NAD(P)-dependent dehydrogenase (short-subunit alcohol dehydrogenase family)
MTNNTKRSFSVRTIMGILKVTAIGICVLLTSVILYLLLLGGNSERKLSATQIQYEISNAFDDYITNAISNAAEEFIFIKKVYKLNDYNPVAPPPDKDSYAVTRDPESLEEVHKAVVADLGPCDILVNGAGGNNPRATTDNEYQHEAKEGGKSFFDLDPSGVDFVFKLNFQGTLLPTQVFAKDLVAKKSGAILNISSMNAYTPLTKIPAYSAAKAGISNFTQWLATHFAGTGIRCNAIAPGFLVSAQNKALLYNEDGTPTARSAKILNGTPTHRFVDADELIGATLFLCDDRSASAITGVVLPVDAGFAAYSGV